MGGGREAQPQGAFPQFFRTGTAHLVEGFATAASAASVMDGAPLVSLCI